jgi:NAD(P)-dependent dehydrogenase (short-subunit alcohol dehydrogenase family)
MADQARDWLRQRFSLDGQRVMVTGASRGIGKALAIGMAHAGADLVLTARTLTALDDTADQVRATGRQAECIACDQSSVAAIGQSLAGLGTVDALVNNAGVEEVSPSLDVSEALWAKIVDTNLRGAFFVAQAVAREMSGRGQGSIINMASLTSFVGVPTAAPYGASKSGVLGLTRALAAEWGPQGIRVNAMAPGYFRTDLTDVFYQDGAWVERMTGQVPLRRLGQLDDLVGAAVFLAGPASAYVSGHCLAIDGGYLAAI